MPSCGPQSAGEKKSASSSNDILPQPDLNCEELNAGCTRRHWVRRVPRVRWQYLPGTIVFVVFGVMRLRLHVPLALLLAKLTTKPVAGQCPSYIEYSEVNPLGSCSRWHRCNAPRLLTERHRRAHWVSHICGQTLPVERSQAPRWK